MAKIRQMQVSPIRGEQYEFSWEAKIELSSVGNSSWHAIPKGIKSVAFTISPNPTGSGKVQITTDTIVDIENDIALAVDWPSGTVSEVVQDACVAVTAFRLVNVSGDMKLTARAA
jgi:hypothetical protein